MFCPKGVHPKPGLGLPHEKSSQQLLGPSFPDLLPWNLQLEAPCPRGLSQAASIPCELPLWKWCVGVQFCVCDSEQTVTLPVTCGSCEAALER